MYVPFLLRFAVFISYFNLNFNDCCFNYLICLYIFSGLDLFSVFSFFCLIFYLAVWCKWDMLISFFVDQIFILILCLMLYFVDVFRCINVFWFSFSVIWFLWIRGFFSPFRIDTMNYSLCFWGLILVNYWFSLFFRFSCLIDLCFFPIWVNVKVLLKKEKEEYSWWKKRKIWWSNVC